MKPTTQKLTAKLVFTPGVVLIAGAIGLLVADHIVACWQAPGDEVLVENLTKAAKEDPLKVPVLRTELERQTDASLAREARVGVATYILICAVVMLLVGAKWSIALGGRRTPDLNVINAQASTSSWGSKRSTQRAALDMAASAPCQQSDAEIIDLALVDTIVAECGRGPEAAIPILHGIQSRYNYLPDAALQRVCEITQVTPAQVIGVSSFYNKFRRSPVGKHIIKICHGTACHVAGAPAVTDELRRSLGIGPDADTDARRLFTIEPVACLGCCTLAPVMQIDDVTYGHLAPDMVPDVLSDFLDSRRNGDTPPRKATQARGNKQLVPAGEIRIGLGSCCIAGGSEKVYEALEQAVEASGTRVSIKRVGCVGMCHRTPLVEAVLPGQPAALYAGVGPEDARAIVRRHFRADGIARRLANTASDIVGNIRRNGASRPVTRLSIEVRDPPVAAFLDRQKHIATEHCGDIDPIDLDEYLLRDGFKALRSCVRDMTPEGVIEEVRGSGLRGRGGAGFPTALKWDKVREATSETKYLICNGDEGDPGAFMDRMIMESYPYRIIEGMTIAAFAVGARQGYFYIRAEYPLAVKRIREALGECEDRGILGDSILGTETKLRLNIMEGAGAFICGEETALITSIEGNRGTPKFRPPYPADSGLWGKPTLVNNVETYATVPWIIRNGAAAFANLGTKTSKGTKVFSLAGKIRRGGLIEVPMGVTVREIVEDIGGGIKGGRRFKAVQIGGPSGGCIPAALADTPVDYEALIEVGAIMGSGGLVVLDESDCMVDIARYFLSFTQDQSCGKCTFCRIGTRRMLDILDRLCAGKGQKGDLEALEQLARSVGSGSLCGLGRTAPNPVLSTLRYFREEYLAHLEGRCPAGKCKDLISYRVTDGCIGCTLCAQQCPVDAIGFAPYQKHEIQDDKCTRCDTCRAKCPENAIEVV